PCAAATAAIYRETSMGWAIFAAAWTTGIAYSLATIFYQIATLAKHPTSSMAWVAGLLALFIAVIGVLYSYRKLNTSVN
ncbi:MAG: ferrous iron transporter B, partial [Proteobacteria bacterium]|nr:ferrous iron transporter B [Pseudomonadota bacterium]